MHKQKTKQQNNKTKPTTNNMSLVCEISGEPLLGNNENEIVVTPSGHICIKRLLLTKLVENAGVDPFETTRQLPLSEDQLVTLQTGSSNSTGVAAPPRPQATSLPNMLGLIQKEYDALVLELFDTRKALEETRRELSQALYQNDAAIRVVARVAQERDTVKQQLEQWNASANAPTSTTDAAATTAAASGGDSAAAAKTAAEPSATTTTAGEEQPSAKRRRILEPTAEILENDLPDEDLKAMSEVWAQLNKVRKPTLKAAAAEAISPKTLGDCAFLETKAWHKSTNRGIPGISSSHDGESYLTVTAGKDKQLVVYNEVDQVVQHTFNFGLVATCVDIGKSLVVAGSVKGTIAAFSVGGEGGSSKENTINVGSKVVNVCVHPTGQHVCAATVDGRVIVACWIAEEQRLQQIATFQATKEGKKDGYTSAALHPDGLIYVAGTKTGKLHVWDFKNKLLAATLQEGEEGDATTAVAVSNNGYHIAAGHDSTAVRFWDLRKQKTVATLDKPLASIKTVAFDRAGKYAAIGGKGGVKITTIKEWGTTASFETKKPVSGIVWSSSKSNNSVLEVSCDLERAVQLFGIPSSDVEMEK